MELYGLKSLPAWKAYSDGTPAWRIFDVAHFPEQVLTMRKEEASRWRELEGYRLYWGESELRKMSAKVNVELVPRLDSGAGHNLPQSIRGMHEFLEQFKITQVAINVVTPGNSEGLVLRTQNRRIIAKARFQDYDRTLTRQAQK